MERKILKFFCHIIIEIKEAYSHLVTFLTILVL